MDCALVSEAPSALPMRNRPGTLTCPNRLIRTITPNARLTFEAGCMLRSRRSMLGNAGGSRWTPPSLMRKHSAAAWDDGFQADYTRQPPMVAGSHRLAREGTLRIQYGVRRC